MIADQRPVVVIACKVFQDLLEHFLPPDVANQVTFLDYGLHQISRRYSTNKAVQEQINSAFRNRAEFCWAMVYVVMVWRGIQAGRHTLFIPRADDCIAILLGSYQAYLREFSENPGTYYLTKGWLESGSDPLKEYHEAVEKYGTEDCRMDNGPTVPELRRASCSSLIPRRIWKLIALGLWK